MLERGIAQLGLAADESFTEVLLGFLTELIRWNKAYNLTAIRDPAEMVSRHLLDSLTVAPYIKTKTVLDVGTGAGLPGIPLALLYPDTSFYLLDSNGKKIRFIDHAVRTLGLQNVKALQARVESHPGDTRYDTVVCRAYASLLDFISSSGSLLAEGGEMIAMKGKVPQAELDELPLQWVATAVDKVEVPGVEGERHIVVIKRKTAH